MKKKPKPRLTPKQRLVLDALRRGAVAYFIMDEHGCYWLLVPYLAQDDLMECTYQINRLHQLGLVTISQDKAYHADFKTVEELLPKEWRANEHPTL